MLKTDFVYIVLYGSYDNTYVDRVFDSKETAELYVVAMNRTLINRSDGEYYVDEQILTRTAVVDN